jgi:hypothetical protein
MAKIEILSWKDFVEPSAWNSHGRSELQKRLRSGINAPLREIKRLAQRIHARELVCLDDVREEAVLGVVQILRIAGAETRVTLKDRNDEQLFKKWPKRGI